MSRGRSPFVAAALLAAALLLQGCATTRLQPNRRLAPGETVVTPSVTLTSFGYPARVALGVASGGQDGELLFDAGLTWIGLEMGAGGRAYLGSVNAAVRVGLVLPLFDGEAYPVPGWDLRLTSRTTYATPFYVGALTSGAVSGEGVIGVAGALVGWERWWSGRRGASTGLQIELSYAPVGFGADGVDLVGPSSDYSPLPLMLQLGIAVHFGSEGRMPSPPGAGAVRADR